MQQNLENFLSIPVTPAIFIGGLSGQIITTSAEVTLNGGLIRELPQNPLNSGLGIILICPDLFVVFPGRHFGAGSVGDGSQHLFLLEEEYVLPLATIFA